MFSIRRSCQSALKPSSSIHHISNGPRRAFSQSSACRRGTLPVFLEASTPELSATLRSINQRILLPQYLTKDQAKLVYKEENRAKLEAEPIELTLGDVTLPLEHLDINRDIPARWPTVKKVIAESKTPEDWENVVRMMEGFETSPAPLKKAWKEMIVRHLGAAGQHHLILKAAQRAAHTGLKLNDKGMVQTVFRVLHWKAAESNWDPEETEKALRLSEHFVELLEGDEHMGKKEVLPGDVRASPYTIAVPLEMAAVRAKQQTDGHDTDGKVAKLASRFMNATKQDDFLASLDQDLKHIASPVEVGGKLSKTAANIKATKTRMQDMLPLWTAVRTARKVLGADMPMATEAQKLDEALETALQAGEKALEEAIQSNEGIRETMGSLPSQIQSAKNM